VTACLRFSGRSSALVRWKWRPGNSEPSWGADLLLRVRARAEQASEGYPGLAERPNVRTRVIEMHYAALFVKLLAASAATASATLSTRVLAMPFVAFAIAMEAAFAEVEAEAATPASVAQTISNDREQNAARLASAAIAVGFAVESSGQLPKSLTHAKANRIRRAARGQARPCRRASRPSCSQRTSCRTIRSARSRSGFPPCSWTWDASLRLAGTETMSALRQPKSPNSRRWLPTTFGQCSKRLTEERPNTMSGQNEQATTVDARTSDAMRCARGGGSLKQLDPAQAASREQSLTAREQALKERERQIKDQAGALKEREAEVEAAKTKAQRDLADLAKRQKQVAEAESARSKRARVTSLSVRSRRARGSPRRTAKRSAPSPRRMRQTARRGRATSGELDAARLKRFEELEKQIAAERRARTAALDAEIEADRKRHSAKLAAESGAQDAASWLSRGALRQGAADRA
jgi:hypothetical protein